MKKPIEIKNLSKDVNTRHYPNWFDKNKLEKMLVTINSNKFNCKNKIGEFKYIDIKDLLNNIKNNTISEIDSKKDLGALNQLKNAEIIKYKKRTSTQKELLNLFSNLLETISTDNENGNENENENENDNDNDKVNENENENNNENKNKNKNDNIIEKLNNHLDEIIDKSKSFEDQIKLF